jgi:cyanate permease
MKPDEFFRRFALVRTSLALLIASIVGAFLTLVTIVSLFNAEWLRALKTLGLLAGVGFVVWWAIIVAKARLTRRDKPAD